ncbi:unnamed protein product [Effrenium voratum]|nr:unnamed protein product [Effrenium voratum]
MADSQEDRLIVVKNTFIDLDDAPRVPILARYASMPAKFAHEGEEDEPDELDEVRPPAGLPSIDEPPPMPELYRVVTYDGWEPQQEWSWSKGQPLPDPGPGGGYQQPVMPAGPMVIPGSAMVILPNGIMGPVPATIPDDMALPQKFARWPNGIPAPPTEAPSVELKDAPVSPVPDKEPAVLPPARVEPRAPVLQRAFSVNSAIFRIHWTVDAKVLKSSDREKVSPPFEVSMGGKEVQFKMCLRPTVTSESRGGASFRKAKGKGTVDLRCLNELDPARSCPMSFRIAVGKGSDAKRISSTVRHDFSQRAICPLPDGEEEWDFKTVVDEDSQTFVVVLEVVGG